MTEGRTYGPEHDGELADFITRQSKRIARRSPWGPGLAEDLAQTAWAWILDYRARGEREGMHLGAEFQRARWGMWSVLKDLRRLARNDALASAYIRLGGLDESAQTPEALADALDLDRALAQLAGVQGWRFRRAILEGHTSAEIARADGVTPRVVCTGVNIAVDKVCSMLGVARLSREEAAPYFEGPPCPRGHTLRERDKRGKLGCVVCRRAKSARQNAARREVHA